MEKDPKKGHVKPLPIDSITEEIDARPKVPCNDEEVLGVLEDLVNAVDNESYIPAIPTKENPALSDDYIFDKTDEMLVLKMLNLENFVAKVKDVGKGAKRRVEQGLPQEFLYVLKFPCELTRRDADISGIETEQVLIYIKINNRKVPDETVFIISFHKNNPRT